MSVANNDVAITQSYELYRIFKYKLITSIQMLNKIMVFIVFLIIFKQKLDLPHNNIFTILMLLTAY